MSQEELASLVGTSKGNISKWETGERNIRKARVETLEKLASALSCTIDEIVKPFNFQFSPEGALIVDGAYLDRRYPGNTFLMIDGQSYVIKNSETSYKLERFPIDNLQAVRWTPQESAEEWDDFGYFMRKLRPKKIHKPEILNGVNLQTLETLAQKYGATHITEPFIRSKGGMLGEDFRAEMKMVQLTLDSFDAIRAEAELKEQGIEAYSPAGGRLNIRIADK